MRLPFALIVITFILAVGCSRSRRDWNKAVKDNTSAGFSTYIMTYPQGSHVVEARKKIEELDWALATTSRDERLLMSCMKQYPNSPYVAKAHELLTLIGKERKTQLWKRFLSRSDGIYRFSAESSNVNNKRTIRFLVKIASGRETGELTSLSTTTNGSMYFLMPMKGDLVWSKTVPGAFWLNSTSKDVLDNQLFYIGDETLVMSRVGMFGDGPALRFDGTTQ